MNIWSMPSVGGCASVANLSFLGWTLRSPFLSPFGLCLASPLFTPYAEGLLCWGLSSPSVLR
jgi:hypothetical protein